MMIDNHHFFVLENSWIDGFKYILSINETI